MDTSKAPRAHSRSETRINHLPLAPVGGALPLPTERAPIAPPVVEGAMPAASPQQVVLHQHTQSAAAAAAEVCAFADWSQTLGGLVPSATTFANALAFSSAWTEERQAAERWLAHVRENEILAWNHTMQLVDVVKTPLFFAAERDAALAVAMPATLRLVSARAEVGRQGARKAIAARRRAATPPPALRTGRGAEVPGDEGTPGAI